MRGFASDNWAGAHPEVLAALAAANDGHAPAYGADGLTTRAADRVRDLFGGSADVLFAFNGTGANVIGLQAATRPHNAVLCAALAHIDVDECGAPERFTGCKLIALPAPHGKVAVDDVRARALQGRGDEHHVQPRVLSLSQATEQGTVYTADEVRALADASHEAGLVVHMDGARLANAAASLGVAVRDFTTDAGVDVLTFGATKNGALYGEAVVVLDTALAADLAFIRKQGMQLASKMRFLAAQFDALLTDDLWLRSAAHANAMAARLAAGLEAVEGISLAHPVQANAVFAALPPAIVEPLQEVAPFYIWDEAATVARLMCSFDTEESDIDAFVAAAGDLAARYVV
jgi:threonine aldolase